MSLPFSWSGGWLSIFPSKKNSTINELCQKDILLNEYPEDVICKTKRTLRLHGVSEKEQKYLALKQNVIFPWSPTYNSLRLNFNRLNQYFPLFLWYVCCDRDVVEFLRFCILHKFGFCIRGGGHSYLGYSLNYQGVIDMSRITKVNIGFEARHENDWYDSHCLRKGMNLGHLTSVTVGSGIKLGALVLELTKNSLALNTGTCSNVCVAGLTLGGGIGFMVRSFGLTMDSLISCSIVIAQDPKSPVLLQNISNSPICPYRDLFWAIRGAGNGQFGVITDLTFACPTIECVIVFEMRLAKTEFAVAFNIWQRWAPTTDRRLSCELNYLQYEIVITGQFIQGTQEELTELLSVFPYSYNVQELKYIDAVRKFASLKELYIYNKSAFAINLWNEDAISLVIEWMNKPNAPTFGELEFEALGGRFADFDSMESAFPYRSSPFWVQFRSSWSNPDLERINKTWLDGFYEAMKPFFSRNTIPQAYVNVPQIFERPYQFMDAYWGRNKTRLREVKAKYDPRNIFSSWPQAIF